MHYHVSLTQCSLYRSTLFIIILNTHTPNAKPTHRYVPMRKYVNMSQSETQTAKLQLDDEFLRQ